MHATAVFFFCLSSASASSSSPSCCFELMMMMTTMTMIMTMMLVAGSSLLSYEYGSLSCVLCLCVVVAFGQLYSFLVCLIVLFVAWSSSEITT